MNKTKELRNNKGITMVSLIITIVLMFIVASTTVNVSLERFKLNKYNKMKNDIELLQDKISNYYLKYKGLPVLEDENNRKYTYTTLEFDKNPKDNDNYYIIDLKALDGISLNYGEEGYENPNTSDDVYIINELSRQIYYVKGIELEGIIYHAILDKTSNVEDAIPPTKPEIKIVSGKLNSEKTEYVTEVEIEIVPGKDKGSGINQTTYSYEFIDKNGSTTGPTIPITINENKIIKLQDSGTYKFTVSTTDNNNNISNIIETINTNIQKVTSFKLADVIKPANYGDKIEYEANGVKDWKIFFNDGNNVFIITSDYIPETSKPKNLLMQVYNTYNMYWYGSNPSFSSITENSKILERAEKFKDTWIKENADKEWYNAKAVKDFLNNDIWSVFAEGLNGSKAIGSPTLEMFAESWNQKGYKEITYSVNEDGYSIGSELVFFQLKDSDGFKDSLYFPHPYTNEKPNLWANTYECYSYWLASITIEEHRGSLISIAGTGSIQSAWYEEQYLGMRPVVCLPSNAVATNSGGTWTNLTVN